MNDLILVNKDNRIDARRLHGFLEVGKHFKDWMTDKIERYEFIEGVDYYPFSGDRPISGGRTTKEYMIIISMAKELCMVANNAKGKQARLYFIECEKKLQQGHIQQLDLGDTDHLLALLDKTKELIIENKIQQNQLALQAPMIKEFEQVFDITQLWTFTQAVTKVGLSISSIKLHQYFNSIGYIFKQNNIWVATVEGTASALFNIKEVKDEQHRCFKTLCLNNNGLDYLYNNKEAIKAYSTIRSAA